VGVLAASAVLAIDSRSAYVAMVLTDMATFLLAAAALDRLRMIVPAASRLIDQHHLTVHP
jgi:hypothetical protein